MQSNKTYIKGIQMLEISNLDVGYGEIHVLHDVSLSLAANEITAIIGANGAGKSTLIRSIMGLLKPRAGAIAFGNLPLSKMPTHKIVRSGVTCVPEGRKIFPRLTVQDNLEMGAYSHKTSKKELTQQLEEVYALFPRLHERRKQLGGTLSGGEQQMLAMGRGIMNQPKILLLDEPSLGLAPIIVDEMFDCILNIRSTKKIPILLVEQNAYSALEISDKGYVLELGHIVKQGKSKELMLDSNIRKAYLGG